MNKFQQNGLRSLVEIKKTALKHNYKVFRKIIGPDCKFLVVAKSNAYGHSIFEYAKTLADFGADWIAVDSITEAIPLRQSGLTLPILVLGYTLPDLFAEAIKYQITLTISSLDQLKNPEIADLDFHLKVDTGMHRQGFLPEQIPELITNLKNKKITPSGLYTHFAAAKNPAFPAQTQAQIALFDQIISQFHQAGFTALLKHAAASSGILVFPDSKYDMVRVGIGMMGLWPAKEVHASLGDEITLKPALSWKSLIVEIKTLPQGASLGYDFTEKLSRQTQIAICPIGYWHGYRRSLSSIGHVLIRGQRARVLGRVTMDMITLDVTGLGAKVYDEVTLLGRDGPEEITAEALASLCDTSAYEIVTQINPLIKRIYL